MYIDIYRFKMYHEERGEKELALDSYRSLEPTQMAANCNDCGSRVLLVTILITSPISNLCSRDMSKAMPGLDTIRCV